MAIQIPVITEFVDKGLKDAKGAFGNFKAAVSGAEGAMGKFKAGSTVALDTVKANAGAFALGAGSAIATFGAAAITAFQDLAIEAGKFADATGLAVEDASRWIEVAGDFGIEAGTIETAIGKMNKELGSNPGLVKALGDDISYAKDGTLNVNETFLKLIDRLKAIKDPAERAKEAAKLLGKQWRDSAELIELGGDKLRMALAGVSDAKIITEPELDKARRFRETMDGIKDKAEDLTITLGSDLVGAIEAFQNAHETGIVQVSKGNNQWMVQTAVMIAQWAGLGDTAKLSFVDVVNGAIDSALKIDDMNSSMLEAADAMDEMKASWDELTAQINSDMAFRNFEGTLLDIKEAGIKAFGGTKQDVIDYQNQVDRGKIALIELAGELDIVGQKRVKPLIETGQLQEAYDLILKIKNNISEPMRGSGISPSGIFGGPRAAGGPVTSGTSYLVGENGPEIFTPSTSGSIIPNGGVGGGMNITVNVSGADPNAVVRALQQYVRQSGPVPVNTRTM